MNIGTATGDGIRTHFARHRKQEEMVQYFGSGIVGCKMLFGGDAA